MPCVAQTHGTPSTKVIVIDEVDIVPAWPPSRDAIEQHTHMLVYRPRVRLSSTPTARRVTRMSGWRRAVPGKHFAIVLGMRGVHAPVATGTPDVMRGRPRLLEIKRVWWVKPDWTTACKNGDKPAEPYAAMAGLAPAVQSTAPFCARYLDSRLKGGYDAWGSVGLVPFCGWLPLCRRPGASSFRQLAVVSLDGNLQV